jgi:hypothetical protein
MEVKMIKVIKLTDGLEVEVEVDESQAHEISDKEIVESSMDKIEALLMKVIKPISNTYNEISKEMCIESTKVSIGIKIGLEGNFILAKTTTSANIQVEMILRPTHG